MFGYTLKKLYFLYEIIVIHFVDIDFDVLRFAHNKCKDSRNIVKNTSLKLHRVYILPVILGIISV